MRKYIFVLVLFCVSSVYGQQYYRQLSHDAEIQILTIGPGNNLEDSFGHSAIWIHDKARDIDWVYNYGVFDFDTPNFLLKFASGKLPYKLGIGKYDHFLASYKAQNRWIKSQKLDLNVAQKQQLFDYLQRNALPENKFYKYDFFYDNCATRLIDITEKSLGTSVVFNYEQSNQAMSHRDLIHTYVPRNSWGALGIDLALGSIIDRPALPEDFRFLPDYTMEAFAKAQLKTNTISKLLVSNTQNLFTPQTPIDKSTPFWKSPLLVFLIIALALIYKTYLDAKTKTGIGNIDIVLFSISSLVGIILLLLWFATDHSATVWNYNLLWAFPFHIFAAFVLKKKNPPQWIYPYMKLTLILLVLLFFHWILGVQIYPLPLLPFFIALGIRYVYILKVLKTIRDS